MRIHCYLIQPSEKDARIMLESRVGKVSFYEKLGYSKMSDEVIHGDTFDCIPMVKVL